MTARREGGFTLIELMIVVTIMGILAMVCMPRFTALIRKANEGSSKGNLGALRSSLSIYYSDMDGQYPSDLGALTVGGKYLQAFPVAKVPNYHADATTVAAWNGGLGDDSGGWAYDAAPGDPQQGSVLVNCLHTDSRGVLWTSY